MPFALTSYAFADGQEIPRKHTCDGLNISPQFAWHDVPAETQSLLFACLDPDAPGGTFHHWVAYNIPPDLTELEEGYRGGMSDPRFAQALNDFGKLGYGGPCPPHGHHRHGYRFRLSALREDVRGGTPRSKCGEILAAAQSLEIGATEIVGYYGR